MHEGSRSLSKDLLGDSILNEMDAKDREEKLARHEMKALQEAVIDIFVNLCGSGNSVKVVLPHLFQVEFCLKETCLLKADMFLLSKIRLSQCYLLFADNTVAVSIW